MTISDFSIQKEIKKVRAEYRRKLQELRRREKESLARLYATYYLAEGEEERAAIEKQILKILENERKDTQ
ncbi:MAG: hypothetical protein IJ947_04425 [Phascolarctobacterium sp.]|nr:hypothetical protein [Phascolarctobacterium sp.]MBR2039619.1 hypothetical protein [Phascolarctobacterium sp.]